MQRHLFAVVAVCLLAPASARANDLFDLIPGNTYGYVVIASASDMDAKLQSLGQRINLPIPSLLSMINAKAKGPSGIDPNGSVGLAVLPTDTGPSGVLYIPLDDYDALIKQLDTPSTEDGVTTGRLWEANVVIGRKESHAVVTWTTRRNLLLNVLADREADGQADAIKRPKRQHDITASISSSGIAMLTQLAKQGLNQATQVIKTRVGEESPALAGIQMYDQMLTALESEIRSCSLSIRLDDEGALSFINSVRLKASGKLAPTLREIQPLSGDLLAGFPDVPYVFAGGGVIPEGSMQSMMDFSGSMMKSMQQLYAMEPGQIDAMMKLAMKYFSDMRGMSFVFSVGQADAPLYNGMLATIHVPDAQKYLDDYRKYWDELSELIANSEGSFLQDAKLEDMKLDGRPMLKMTMPMPMFNQIDGANQADIDALMSKLYGASAMTAYIVAADEQTILVGYSSTELLRKAFSSANDESNKLSNNPGIASTSKLLPKDALMVGFWDVSGTISFANRMMHMMPASDPGFEIPAFPAASPIGWAMRARRSTVTFHTVVPSETLDAVGVFVKRIKDSRNPGDE